MMDQVDNRDKLRGISEVINEIRLRIFIFVVVGCLASISVTIGGPLILVVPILLVTLVGTLTSMWRLNILEERRFIRFTNYTRSLLGFGKGASRACPEDQVKGFDLTPSQGENKRAQKKSKKKGRPKGQWAKKSPELVLDGQRGRKKRKAFQSKRLDDLAGLWKSGDQRRERRPGER
jgi:hypothetical protein